MTKAETRKPKLEIRDWEQAYECMAAYALAVNDVAKADALLREAEWAAKQARNATAKEHEQRVEELAKLLRKFAKKRHAEFVAIDDGGQGRTRTHAGVEIGYEWGKPYVQIDQDKFNAALAWLREFGGDVYVREKPQVNREALRDLLQASNGDPAEQTTVERFAGQGITLEQDEEFVLRVVPTQG